MATVKKIFDFLASLPRVAWGILVVIVSVLVAIFAEQKKNEAEAALKHADADKKDAVLEERQNGLRIEEAKVVAEGEKKKKQELTPEELAKETSKV